MDSQEVKRNQILIDFIKENYLKKIEKLDDVKGFIREEIIRYDKDNKPINTEKYIVKNEDTNEVEKDENGNPVLMSTHIMYKITKDGEVLKIRPKDKKYYYEFLIEFDTKDFGYGIYYGCKAVIDNDVDRKTEEFKNIINEIDKATEQYKQSETVHGKNTDDKYTIELALNRSFNMDASNKWAFIPTNNYNDNIYWPFWIKLHEEDDIEFAVHAIKIIANFYSVKLTVTGERLFDDYSFVVDEKLLDETNVDAKTVFPNYTFNKYIQIIKKLKKELGSKKMYENYKKNEVALKKEYYKKSFKIYIDFLHKLELEGKYIERDKYLEFGWKINEIYKFSQAYAHLFNEMGFLVINEKEKIQIPWSYIDSITTTSLKQNNKKMDLNDVEAGKEEFKEIMGESFFNLLKKYENRR